ncbi:MAG: hypothetical protein Q7J77_09250 [Undibacterium sp.]|nr:hypothetical protein [Undibacterium sp.]
MPGPPRNVHAAGGGIASLTRMDIAWWAWCILEFVDRQVSAGPIARP